MVLNSKLGARIPLPSLLSHIFTLVFHSILIRSEQRRAFIPSPSLPPSHAYSPLASHNHSCLVCCVHRTYLSANPADIPLHDCHQSRSKCEGGCGVWCPDDTTPAPTPTSAPLFDCWPSCQYNIGDCQTPNGACENAFHPTNSPTHYP